MSNNPFASPAPPGAGIQWEDHKGRLLLIEPKAHEAGIQTAFGVKDAVRADVTVIDADDAPAVYLDALIFPTVLIQQTRPLVGEMILGRLGQGAAKGTQNAPWKLEDASPADIETGKRYLASRTPVASNPFASANAGGSDKPPF